MQMSRAQRVAVTGVNGFVGRHLVQELLVAGVDVVGVGHEERAAPDGLSDYVSQDLTAGWPKGLDVDAVVHLAGLSAVGPSFAEPQRYLADNSAMVTHLCRGRPRRQSANAGARGQQRRRVRRAPGPPVHRGQPDRASARPTS